MHVESRGLENTGILKDQCLDAHRKNIGNDGSSKYDYR
jgi:hypothetical protein